MSPHPDGMATMAAERDHMREMRNQPGPKYRVVAVDSDGNELYEIDAAWSLEEAEEDVAIANREVDLPKETSHGLVAGFEHREN